MNTVDVVHRFLQAERDRRPLRMFRLTTRDLILRLPAESELLGPPEHRGRMRATRAMARVLWMTRWSLAISPQQIKVDTDTVRAKARITARRKSRLLDATMSFRFGVREGRICLIEEHVEDLDQWLSFWANDP